LSREERQRYLVRIDDEGMLCWAKNGERISTSPEWKDSMDGIVPITDKTTPTWRNTPGRQQFPASSSDEESDSDISVGSGEDASRYVNQELHDAKGLSKLKHLSANTIMNDLLRYADRAQAATNSFDPSGVLTYLSEKQPRRTHGFSWPILRSVSILASNNQEPFNTPLSLKEPESYQQA
jgi:hypothetical protein